MYLRGGIADTRIKRRQDSSLAPSKRLEGGERLLGSAAALRSPFGARDGSFALWLMPRPRNIRRLVQVGPAKQPRRPVLDPRRIGRHEAVRPRAAVDAVEGHGSFPFLLSLRRPARWPVVSPSGALINIFIIAYICLGPSGTPPPSILHRPLRLYTYMLCHCGLSHPAALPPAARHFLARAV